MSLKIRINLIITVILALVVLVGTLMMLKNAREDIRAEVDSTTVLALHLLDAELLHYTSDYGWANSIDNDAASIFRLQSLDNLRHLRIEFFDSYGRLRDSNRPPVGRNKDSPPAWFESWMSQISPALEVKRRSIIINSRVLGELVITPDPSYEIAEIWHDTFGFLMLGILFFFIVNGVVYWAVGSALRPLNKILRALTELELEHLNVRLPQFSLPELSIISRKFNTMAETLENSISSNHRLTQQMIRLQEDERKNIAQDLHDEIGQHLTAINIDATAILQAKSIKAAHESAMAISDVVMQMMVMVRAMLQRLRPATLDELGLNSAISELIQAWRQRNRNIIVITTISNSLEDINETIAIAAYRIIQESLTNITKHAKANLVTIKVEKIEWYLSLWIQDNGIGFDPSHNSKGLGLAGIRERVQGLGGKCYFDSNFGVLIKVSLPVVFKGET